MDPSDFIDSMFGVVASNTNKTKFGSLDASKRRSDASLGPVRPQQPAKSGEVTSAHDIGNIVPPSLRLQSQKFDQRLLPEHLQSQIRKDH